jgi:hypothetical protein
LIEINSVRDHIHILFAQSKNHGPAKIVEQVKSSSSGWIKEQHAWYADFAWQSGYGEFSVSPLHVEAVREYIRDQPEHHNRRIFRPSIAGFARRTGNRWMNGMRGIELNSESGGDFVPPFQGGWFIGSRDPGLRFASARAITLRAFSPSKVTQTDLESPPTSGCPPASPRRRGWP